MPAIASRRGGARGCLVLLLVLAVASFTHAFHFKAIPQRSVLPQRLVVNTRSSPLPTTTSSPLFPLVRRQAEYINQLAGSRKKRAPAVQWGALGKWVLATGLQFATIVAFMYGMEQAFAKLKVGKDVSLWVVRAFFAFMSLRSRVFSILDNSRPSVASEQRKRRDKKRPSWM